jgi:DNA-binding beta-propeller fold protein YncE
VHQNHLAARTLWALGIAALLVACANSGYSGTVTPSGVDPDSQTRLAQIGPDVVVQFVYAANYDSANVSAYTINATSGKLTPVAGSPFGAGTEPEGVAVDPTGKFAYVANYGSDNVSAYTINATSGKLKSVAGSPFGAGTNPTGVAVNPKGTFAYVTNSGSDNVSA